MKKVVLLCVGLSLACSTGACLKTRAQLKDDDDSGSMPNQPEAVKPQGGYVVDELKSEITRLTGRVEDLEHQLKEARESAQEKDKGPNPKDLEKRIGELENAQANMLETIQKMEKNSQSRGGGEGAFEKAKASFKEKDYEGAINHLNVYLRDSDADKAEEATFLRGEAYYSLKQYKKAIVDYSKFPEKYNKSKLLPEALWRIGQSFDNLGMKDDASAFYQELIEKFPKNSRADAARRKLGHKGGRKSR
ncbi:MAG TPA: tetratricopeptide repeat protein [Bdellovibrionota bacterium]|nr:tetratricopeptide repeat protein [Bdellovibrionota bacterium]